MRLITKFKNLIALDNYPRFIQLLSAGLGLIHFVLLCVMLGCGFGKISYINFLSMAIYAYCWFILENPTDIYRVYFLICGEVMTFTTVITAVFVDKIRFDTYVLALIPFTFMTGYVITRNKYLKDKPFYVPINLAVIIIDYLAQLIMEETGVGMLKLQDSQSVVVISLFNNVTALIMIVLGCVVLLNLAAHIEEDLIQSYNQAEELKEKADTANKAKSAFLASMSHEIRTPINAILGMENMILMESEEDNVKAYASDVLNAGNTLLSLVNDILDFSKIEAGGMTIDAVPYGVGSLVNDCFNMVIFSAKEKNLELSAKCNSEIPAMLLGDEVRIRQIIANLLSNAVKYTNEGGITLDIGFEKTDYRKINLIIKCIDTGMGISPGNIDNIYNSFKRVDVKHNRNIQGTGLGLSITKQLTELMGGDIQVASKVGVGTTFTVTIPQEVIDDTELGEFKAHVTKASDIESIDFIAPEARVLVVDDMEVNLRVFTGLLKNTQLQIDTADSGRKGTHFARNNKYDIIFLDHMMPDLDGIETMELIREDGLNKETPIAILTANAISGSKENYLEKGFDYYLSKPIVLGNLVEVIKESLPSDKIIHMTPEEVRAASAATKSPSNSEIQKEEGMLGRLSFLDTESGLMFNGGDEGLYRDILLDFCKECLADRIVEAFGAEDWKRYATLTHSVKSLALSIGANELSELAKSLELKTKAGEYDYPNENNAFFIIEYKTTVAKIEEALS